MEGAKNCTLDFNKLNKDYTYCFECVSPYNRLVVPYKNVEIYHIGTRNNIICEELHEDIGVQKPKEYKFNSLEDVIKMASELPFSEEGYVAVDVNWNRVKVKSPAYLAAHHLKNNGDVNKKRVLALIMLNDQEEFLCIFPEYKEYFDELEKAFNDYLDEIRKDLIFISDKVFPTKKDYALTVKSMTNPSLMFLIWDGKVKKEEYEKYIRSMPSDKVIDYLHVKNIKDFTEVVE
jgi:hypothetical protein